MVFSFKLCTHAITIKNVAKHPIRPNLQSFPYQSTYWVKFSVNQICCTYFLIYHQNIKRMCKNRLYNNYYVIRTTKQTNKTQSRIYRDTQGFYLETTREI